LNETKTETFFGKQGARTETQVLKAYGRKPPTIKS